MHVALIGASGNVGTRIQRELTSRGHTVTAIARDAGKIPAGPGVTARSVDIEHHAALAAALKGHDAVVSSVRFGPTDAKALIADVEASGVKRFIVVGGAASLEVAPGQRLLDAPSFPEAYRPEATAGAAFLDTLRGVTSLEWTFISPSVFFVPGERTGTFRTDTDRLITGADGQSRISYEDYAIALVDELEHPKHIRSRFTVGY
ncbi:MAG TPA: NAD(P)-dependent oxidoreductase [Stellaceae bacterium]|nr:NAD(P)-dependent oxidoreductase [Stellaceae bacterium]